MIKWEHDASYMSNIEILKGFKVVNDLAEKGVRLAYHRYRKYFVSSPETLEAQNYTSCAMQRSHHKTDTIILLLFKNYQLLPF